MKMSSIPQLMGGRALEHGIALAVDHGGFSSSKMYVGGQAAVQTAASSAFTNSTDETAISTMTIPANSLVAGSTIRVRAAGIATATNSTDTLTVQLKLDTTATAIGSAESVVSTGDVDVANNDIYDINAMIVVRSVGSSGTAIAIGSVHLNAEGDARSQDLKAQFTIDTTVENTLQITADWSVANAGNSMRSDIFVVDIVNPAT
jgi:hypothetical protein